MGPSLTSSDLRHNGWAFPESSILLGARIVSSFNLSQGLYCLIRSVVLVPFRTDHSTPCHECRVWLPD